MTFAIFIIMSLFLLKDIWGCPDPEPLEELEELEEEELLLLGLQNLYQVSNLADPSPGR